MEYVILMRNFNSYSFPIALIVSVLQGRLDQPPAGPSEHAGCNLPLLDPKQETSDLDRHGKPLSKKAKELIRSVNDRELTGEELVRALNDAYQRSSGKRGLPVRTVTGPPPDLRFCIDIVQHLYAGTRSALVHHFMPLTLASHCFVFLWQRNQDYCAARV